MKFDSEMVCLRGNCYTVKMSQWICAYLLNATCAAITRWRSTTRRQFGHEQSRHLHDLLWPLRQETTPWLRHRAHFGVRSDFLIEVVLFLSMFYAGDVIDSLTSGSWNACIVGNTSLILHLTLYELKNDFTLPIFVSLYYVRLIETKFRF